MCDFTHWVAAGSGGGAGKQAPYGTTGQIMVGESG